MRAVDPNGLLPPLRVLLLLLLLLVVLAAPAIADDGVGQQQDDVRALVEEGRELVDTRRFDEAAAALERALALDPGCPGALVQLGRASAFQGGYDEAAAQYALALEADPSYAPAMTALGKLHAFRGRHDEALAAFEGALAAVAEGGAEEADALLGLARLTAQASRDPDGFQRAEALYGRGLAITPENEQALFDQGLVLSQLGKHEVRAWVAEWIKGKRRLVYLYKTGRIISSILTHPHSRTPTRASRRRSRSTPPSTTRCWAASTAASSSTSTRWRRTGLRSTRTPATWPPSSDTPRAPSRWPWPRRRKAHTRRCSRSPRATRRRTMRELWFCLI